MTKQKLIDYYDAKVKFDLVESNEVDGEHVLAKVRGVFFVPDGKSRNGRFYPKELWETVLSDPKVKQRLSEKSVYGTVGHDQKIDDNAMLNGLVSHIVTSMEIVNGKGIGEALILNTKAGKVLNTIMRAGGQMYVSTRADGTFEGKKNGLPIVSAKTYDFQTVDFVMDAGFLEANPSIAESFNNIMESNNYNKEGITMNEKLVELITEENKSIKKQVVDLNSTIVVLGEEKVSLIEENDHLKGEQEKLEEANKKIKEMEDEKEKEEKDKEEMEETLKAFTDLADTPEELKETLEEAKEFIKVVTEDLDGIEGAKKALNMAIEFKESVDKAGGLDSLVEAKDKVKEMEDEAEKEKMEKETKELAEECGLSTEKVAELLEKYSMADIKEMFSALSESIDNDVFKKRKFSEKKDDKEEEEEEEGKEGVYESRILGSSVASRVRV